MRIRFHPPASTTALRLLGDEELFLKLLSKAEPWILLDEGVPLPFEFEGRGAHVVAGGEEGKRWSELEKILEWLAHSKAERSQPLLVVGGGAVLDLGALAASLFKRGMPLILVPSTLLGMVDATLGGKTAVDMESEGRLLKNFVGTFYPASEVWLFPDFLSTLSLRERISGAGEVYKTMWIRGGKWKQEALLLFVRTGQAGGELLKLVKQCLELKGRVVEKDPLDDKRVREVLNFGHTAGHALESASGLSHGECILWGMAVESALLGSRAMTSETIIALKSLDLALPEAFSREVDWENFLSADKKIKSGKLEMSLLSAPGKIVRKKYSLAQVAQALRAFPESYRRA